MGGRAEGPAADDPGSLWLTIRRSFAQDWRGSSRATAQLRGAVDTIAVLVLTTFGEDEVL